MSDPDRWDDDDDQKGDLLIDSLVEKAKPKVKKPPMYQIVMLNDDYTPMLFVVAVLMKFFNMDEETAFLVMYTIHMFGKSVVGVFPKEIAEAKCDQVNEYSRQQNYPLLSTIEQTD